MTSASLDTTIDLDRAARVVLLFSPLRLVAEAMNERTTTTAGTLRLTIARNDRVWRWRWQVVSA